MTKEEKQLLSAILYILSSSIHGTLIEKFAKEENVESEKDVRKTKSELDGLIKQLTGF